MIRNKTIKFNLERQDDRALWEWMEKLPHGQFSESTKNYWLSRKKVEEGTEYIEPQMKDRST